MASLEAAAGTTAPHSSTRAEPRHSPGASAAAVLLLEGTYSYDLRPGPHRATDRRQHRGAGGGVRLVERPRPPRPRLEPAQAPARPLTARQEAAPDSLELLFPLSLLGERPGRPGGRPA